jgi:hypothetical protein
VISEEVALTVVVFCRVAALAGEAGTAAAAALTTAVAKDRSLELHITISFDCWIDVASCVYALTEEGVQL